MRVVDVRDFCIPSDENDYDELVAFADTMAAIPQFDAVPIDLIDKIRTGIANLDNLNPVYLSNGICLVDKSKVLDIIDKYKKESE